MTVDFDNGMIVGLAAVNERTGNNKKYKIGDSISSVNLSELDQQVWTSSDVPNAINIAVDSIGNSYVAYYNAVGTTSVRKLDPNGVELWALSDIGYARDIAVDSLDNVCVAYYSSVGTTSVRKLDPYGVELWALSDVPGAIGIAVGPAGSVYVAYCNVVGVTGVRKLDASGNQIWASSDVAYPYGIAVDSIGNAYVAYYGNAGYTNVRKLNYSTGNQIWVSSDAQRAYDIAVDPSGTFVYVIYDSDITGAIITVRKLYASYGGQVWAKYDVGYPRGIAADSHGNVYVVYHYDAVSIRKLDAAGNQLWALTGYDGTGVAVDSEDNVYVTCAETSGITVCKLSQPVTTPQELWSKTGLSSTTGIAVDSDGNMYVTLNRALGQVTLCKLAPDGSPIWEQSAVAYAVNVVLDSGYLYVSYTGYWNNIALQKMTTDGTIIWSKTGLEMESDHYNRGSCSHIAVNNSGDIYVAVSGGVDGYQFVHKLDSFGNILWRHWVMEYGTTQSLSTDSSGNVYVTWVDEYGVASGVVKIDPNGVTVWSNTDITGADYVSAAVDNEDNVLVVYDINQQGKILRKFDSSGNEIWWSNIPRSGSNIALDSENNIYISRSVAHTYPYRIEPYLYKLNPSGKVMWSLCTSAYIVPKRIIFDALDNMYIAYYQTGVNIQKLRTATAYKVIS